ncbi:MAG: deoxyribonuclease IV, partial [Acidimicrobiia bacterium]
MTLVGAHTPSEHPLKEAEARGADLVQIFLSNPQSWKKPNPRPDAEELKSADI